MRRVLPTSARGTAARSLLITAAASLLLASLMAFSTAESATPIYEGDPEEEMFWQTCEAPPVSWPDAVSRPCVSGTCPSSPFTSTYRPRNCVRTWSRDSCTMVHNPSQPASEVMEWYTTILPSGACRCNARSLTPPVQTLGVTEC